MHKTTLYLEETLYERLLRAADERDVTQSLVLREALETYLSSSKRAPRSIGLGHSGKAMKGRLGERSEELLEGFGRDE
jgi:predicted transcriptional regulator